MNRIIKTFGIILTLAINSLAATKNVVPRANDEGNIGLSTIAWHSVYATEYYGNASNMTGLAFVPSSATGTYPLSISGKAATAGNSDTVSNGVYTTGSYTNPSWLTSLATSKIDLSTVTSHILTMIPSSATGVYPLTSSLVTNGAYVNSTQTFTGQNTFDNSLTANNGVSIGENSYKFYLNSDSTDGLALSKGASASISIKLGSYGPVLRGNANDGTFSISEQAGGVVYPTFPFQIGASSFTVDSAGNVIALGSMTATAYAGDGSALTNLPIHGDNLGNHIATTTLNMAGFTINYTAGIYNDGSYNSGHGATPETWPIQLFKTGQTLCYDSVGAIISCAGTGQDGELQTGRALSERFTHDTSSTTTDHKYNLMWENELSSAIAMNWQSALNWCNSLTLDGYSDWVLPSRRQLESICVGLDNSYYIGYFSAHEGFFWTSTTYVPYTSNAWTVYAGYGYVTDNVKANASYVRCVRVGP